MKTKIITKLYGIQIIDTDTFIAEMASSKSTVFRAVEHIFNEWFAHNTQQGAPLAKDIELCYYGSEEQRAIYSKKGAIRKGIENLIQYIIENKLHCLSTNDFYKADIECAFEI